MTKNVNNNKILLLDYYNINNDLKRCKIYLDDIDYYGFNGGEKKMKYKTLKELIADTENRKKKVAEDYEAFDYYSNKDTCVIHCKFGRMKKGYSGLDVDNGLTQEFVDKFQLFWEDDERGFKSPLEVIEYVIDHNLPVLFYNNYEDEEMTLEEVIRYFDEGE